MHSEGIAVFIFRTGTKDREPPMPRMKILNSVEREVFDFPPIFNSVERKRCFD
jgi:hypothetical protein